MHVQGEEGKVLKSYFCKSLETLFLSLYPGHEWHSNVDEQPRLVATQTTQTSTILQVKVVP